MFTLLAKIATKLQNKHENPRPISFYCIISLFAHRLVVAIVEIGWSGVSEASSSINLYINNGAYLAIKNFLLIAEM
jgi:hypothetical protein